VVVRWGCPASLLREFTMHYLDHALLAGRRNPITTMHYLDHAATTPMHPSAIDAMVAVLRGSYGNPSGVHDVSAEARVALETARDQMAAILGCRARELVFTGGGTESLNLALRGVDVVPGELPVVLTSAIEHDAVTETARWLAATGQAVHEVLPVTSGGVVNLDEAAGVFARHCASAVAVAVMAVNNEIGTVQPIADLAVMLRARVPRSTFIVDAVQAPVWLDLRPICALADFVAVSAHKFGGPKGVGALTVREGLAVTPLLHGGGQERERRSGTQNVAGIVGMAEAARVTDLARSEVGTRVALLRDRLVDGLVGAIDGCVETVGDRSAKVAGNAHLILDGVESESVLLLLNDAGVAASAGSACASGALHVSPVLLALGVAPERAGGALRLTLGAASTDDDVDAVLNALPDIVLRLRVPR
jgi:cysteine desulfurase